MAHTLVYFYIGDICVYAKNDVDLVIADLKTENDRLSNALDKERSETIKYMDELCNAKNEIERLTIDKRNAELRADLADATVEKLKANKQNLEDFVAYFQKKASDFQLMSNICRVRIKEKSRALWLARAERAVAEQTIDEFSRYKEKHPCGSWRADPFEYWVQAWIYVEKLCRKKAEEYK